MADKIQPFASGAPKYLERGWNAPFPLPAGKKFPPPKGVTGYDAEDPSRDQVIQWMKDRPGANIALHLSDSVIGFDVDNYVKGDIEKTGFDQIVELQDELGALPPTWRSSARNDGLSGIYFYRIPEGKDWPSQLGDSIEIIRKGHRYAVVWPSVREDLDGTAYHWYAFDDAAPLSGNRTPAVADLPELPARWIEHLLAMPHATTGAFELKWRSESGKRAAKIEPAEIVSWKDFYLGSTDDGMCRATAGVLRNAQKKLAGAVGSRYQTMLSATFTLLPFAAEGHLGVGSALAQLRDSYFESIKDEKSRDTTEWDRAVNQTIVKMIPGCKDADGKWIDDSHGPKGQDCPDSPNKKPFIHSDPDSALAGSDLYNAEQMVASYGGEIIYRTEPNPAWLSYEDGIWTESNKDNQAIVNRAFATSRLLQANANEEEDAEVAKRMQGQAFQLQNANKARACVVAAQSLSSVVRRGNEFDAKPLLFNHRGGTLEFTADGVVSRDFDIGDLLTQRSSTVYDPSAKHDEWSAFIKRATRGDIEYAKMLRRACFESLTGSTKSKVFLNLFDDQVGNTGKTAFLEVIAGVIGKSYATVIPSNAFISRGNKDDGIRSDLGMMAGKRMVMANEVRADARLDVELMKKLTSGVGEYVFEQKYKNPWSAPLTSTIWLDGNGKPKVDFEQEPLYARWLLMPFTEVIPEEHREAGWADNRLLSDSFKSGVLNWILKGCKEWFQIGGIGICDVVKDAREEARKESDPYQIFWEDLQVEFTENENDVVSCKSMWNTFSGWWKDTQGDSRLPHPRNFASLMKSHGAVQTKNAIYHESFGKGKRDRAWTGVKIKALHER